MRIYFVLVSMVVLGAMVSQAQASCVRQAKSLYYADQTINVYVNDEQWTELIFPGKISGYKPEQSNGPIVKEVPIASKNTVFANRVYVKAVKPLFTGTAFFHTDNGLSYHVRFLYRANCADPVVRIKNADTSQHNGANSTTSQYDPRVRKNGLRLIEYLYLYGGDPDARLPSGFSRVLAQGNKEDRVILRQGSLVFYLYETWSSRNLNGFVLQVENEGRIPARVGLEQINVNNPSFIKRFGRIREATMLPTSFRLGPRPEFAVDQLHPKHKGLVFLAAEKSRVR